MSASPEEHWTWLLSLSVKLIQSSLMLPWSVSTLECIQGLLLFFCNYLLQGAFSFFWDRVSRLVLNSQYPWLSLLSAGITPCLASEKALLPEGPPPFVEYSPTCCAGALGPLQSSACLKLTLVPMMNLDPRLHTHTHMSRKATKNKTTKPPWLWKFHVLLSYLGTLVLSPVSLTCTFCFPSTGDY